MSTLCIVEEASVQGRGAAAAYAHSTVAEKKLLLMLLYAELLLLRMKLLLPLLHAALLLKLVLPIQQVPPLLLQRFRR